MYVFVFPHVLPNCILAKKKKNLLWFSHSFSHFRNSEFTTGKLVTTQTEDKRRPLNADVIVHDATSCTNIVDKTSVGDVRYVLSWPPNPFKGFKFEFLKEHQET